MFFEYSNFTLLSFSYCTLLFFNAEYTAELPRRRCSGYPTNLAPRLIFVSRASTPSTLSSFKIDKQIIVGYTFGWKNPLGNITLGGFTGYSFGNVIVIGNSPPSQGVFAFPGTTHSLHEVDRSVLCFWFCDETVRMVSPPVFSLLLNEWWLNSSYYYYYYYCYYY